MFGYPSWLHFGLALRDIRHKEARSQTPFIEEKKCKNQLGSHLFCQENKTEINKGRLAQQLHQLVHNQSRSKLHRPPHQPIQEQFLAWPSRTTLGPVSAFQSQRLPPATLTLPILRGAGHLVQSIGSSHARPENQLKEKETGQWYITCTKGTA